MHGVTFGTKHSYDDFGLILSSKEIAPPEPKTYIIDIPGGDGQLDLSETLWSDIKYKNRKLQFTFTCMTPQSRWNTIYSDICNYLHGRVMQIILDADRGYYYIGRCKVNQFKSNKRLSTIVIDCDVDPYKYDITSNQEGQWLWDTFSFVDGIIPRNNISISGTTTVTLKNSRKTVQPTIICSDRMSVIFEGKTYYLTSGTNVNTGIYLKEGDNSLIFVGHGTVTIRYERGSL